MEKLNKILLLDDDEVSNYINKDILERLNIANEIQVIEDGEKAFEYLAKCGESLACPELIIFAHQIPNMNGIEVMEALNEVNFLKNNEVVFMFLDINSTQNEIETLKELGVQEFTTKPLSEEKVMGVFNKYWKGKEITIEDISFLSGKVNYSLQWINPILSAQKFSVLRKSI